MIRHLKYKTLCIHFLSLSINAVNMLLKKKEKDKENELIFKSSIS